jgi:hypothetical protein
LKGEAWRGTRPDDRYRLDDTKLMLRNGNVTSVLIQAERRLFAAG